MPIHVAEFTLHLEPLPALADNYIWLLHDDHGHAVVVDPGDASVVETALASRQLRLRAILLTHHHDDHVGGAGELNRRHGAEVFAPVDARIQVTHREVVDGELIRLDQPAVQFRVLAVPGHTLSHVAYAGEGLLFCGDTLFSMGCGRLFEGSPAQMLASLDRLSDLPEQTQVCAGHEYTATNGRFARTIEPDNPLLQQRVAAVAKLRAGKRPTLPVPLATELATNPFLRTDAQAVIDWCSRQDSTVKDRTARFAMLRNAKDAFL